LLAHRDIIFNSTGLYEKFDPCWGWNDIEYAIRMMSQFEWYDLRACGFLYYDMEHKKTQGMRSQKIKKTPKCEIIPTFNANADTWGGTNLDITESKLKLSNPIKYKSVPCTSSHIIIDSKENIEVVSDFVRLFTWKTNWKIKIEENEVILMLLLTAIYDNNLPDMVPEGYLEIGLKKGVSTFYTGYYHKHINIIGVDIWSGTDNDTGPHEISKLLYSDLIGHRGYLRVINKKSDEFLDNNGFTSDGYCKSSLIVYRDDGAVNISKLISITNLLTSNGYIIFLFNSAARIDMFIEVFTKMKLTVVNKDSGIILASNTQQDSLEISSDIITEINNVRKHVENTPYQQAVNFYSIIQNIPDGPLVLYGFGSVAKIIWPHIKDKVIAIIDKELSSNGTNNIDNVPVIKTRDLSKYEDTCVVITPSIHAQKILFNLESYDLPTYILPLSYY